MWMVSWIKASVTIFKWKNHAENCCTINRLVFGSVRVMHLMLFGISYLTVYIVQPLHVRNLANSCVSMTPPSAGHTNISPNGDCKLFSCHTHTQNTRTKQNSHSFHIYDSFENCTSATKYKCNASHRTHGKVYPIQSTWQCSFRWSIMFLAVNEPESTKLMFRHTHGNGTAAKMVTVYICVCMWIPIRFFFYFILDNHSTWFPLCRHSSWSLTIPALPFVSLFYFSRYISTSNWNSYTIFCI